jgi:Flp pilus assembly protein TadG
MTRIRLRLLSSIIKLGRDRRGVSAVEFALVAPLMIAIYLSAVEISQGISIDRKVTLTTRTLADLASQVSSIKNSEMTNILAAGAAVMSPYDQSKMKVTLSGVKIDNNGTAKVDWSDTLNGTKRGVGTTVTLPAALAIPNTFLLWSEVSYAFKPTIGYMITGTINLTDQLWMRPRLSDTVTRVNS